MTETANQTITEQVHLVGTPRSGSPKGGERWRAAAGHLSLTAPAFLLITLFFIFPIVVVIVLSVTDPVFGFQNYAWVFTSPLALNSAVTTLIVSLGVTLVCLLMAYPYAYLMTIVSDRTRGIMTMLVMVPMWTSILVRTLAWVVLLQDSGPINALFATVGIGHVQLIRSPFGVGIGMAQVLLPFMVMPLYSSISRIEQRLVPAAQSLGARPLTAFFTVFLPLSKPGILSGSVTVFILALGFYIIPSLLGSPQDPVFPALIQLQVSGFLDWGRGTALGVCLLTAALLALFLMTKITKSGFKIPGRANAR